MSVSGEEGLFLAFLLIVCRWLLFQHMFIPEDDLIEIVIKYLVYLGIADTKVEQDKYVTQSCQEPLVFNSKE